MKRCLLFALSGVLLLSGCKSNQPLPDKSSSTATPAAAPKVYNVRGKIVSVNGADVLLDHEAVPGFMDAMTMSYKLKDPSVASELHPGDQITANLLVSKDADGFNNILLDNIVVVAQARPDYKPAVQYHVPQPGDVVPNFKLLNENDQTIHLTQFHGRVLLITFIYTRCTLPDFCIRMSNNFAEINKALAADPALYARTHLLSVSFDPAYDTPKVLRKYGETYIGPQAQQVFKHWDFAATSAADLPAITQFFNVGVTPGDNQSFNHSLSTVLIGKDGKIAAWYPTNDWKPQDVLSRIKQAAAA